MKKMIILNLTKVTKYFQDGIIPQKKFALREIHFDVHEGESVALIGPNGAGKTTTIKLIMGFIFPNHGIIKVFNRNAGNPHILQKIGYVSDHPNFYEYLTGEEYLYYCGKLYGLSDEIITKQIKKYTEQLEIEHALKQKLRSYSRGMGQRLNMVQALLHNPELIILDEPLNGLDPIGRKLFRNLIMELKKEGKTIFFSSHILEDAEMIADRVLFLKEGKIIFDGNITEIKKDIPAVYDISFQFPDDKIESVKNLFASLSFSAMEFDNNLVHLFDLSETFLHDALTLALKHQGKIQNIEKREPSLEKIFLDYYQKVETK